eukprot:TRINITY_DN36159_c0_g1_i1.p2 TRINITY_DN36159_c0_g1~~TRINITY_DN36159_c0_g1_i1.p2  ORF type:complete len:197 (+),score=74.81 TRINITY_DN36159_c0_g1_i1:91-681(+)
MVGQKMLPLLLCVSVAAALNPYTVLQVERDATASEIRKAYRARSMETHPDQGGSKEAFIEVSEAYKILSDPAARRTYDRTGERPEGAKPTFEQAEMDFEELLKMFESWLESDEGIDNWLSSWGTPKASDQTTGEWFFKGMLRRGIKWFGPWLAEQVRSGNIQMEININGKHARTKKGGYKEAVHGKKQQNVGHDGL